MFQSFLYKVLQIEFSIIDEGLSGDYWTIELLHSRHT